MAVDNQPAMADAEATDIARLWREALQQYYINTKQDLTTLPRFTSVSAVMNDGELQNDAFNEYRHPAGKVNQLRSALSRNINLIQTGAQYLAQAAAPAFPPSAAILTAFTYMLKGAKSVSEDYDRIISFYDEMNGFLERVSIIERRLPAVPAFRTILMRVFSALMNICGIATRKIAKGRFKAWFKGMTQGPDDDLKAAYGDLEKFLKNLESACAMVVVANTEEIKYDTKKIDARTQLIDATTRNTDVRTQSIDATTQNIDAETQKLAVRAQYIDSTTQNIYAETQNIGVSMTAGFEEVTKQLSKMMLQSQKATSKAQAIPESRKTKDPSAKKQAAFHQVKKKFAPNGDPSAHESREIEFSFVKGTATWIFEHETYRSWVEEKGSVLWLTGPPGIGKTCIAYSIIDALKRSYSDETHNPVAFYFFREEQHDLRSIADALSSIIFQAASRDRLYCETVAHKVHHDEKIDLTDIGVLWNTFFASIFTKTSETELFLVLDGLDEALEDGVTRLLEVLKQVKMQKLNIHVLITGQQDLKDKLDALEPQTIEVTHDIISKDIRRLIFARFKTLSRLRKFSRQSKLQIAHKLREKADGMLYAEHVLRRLNSIGREGAALRYVRESLPNSLSELYALMLAECQKRRTPEQFETLRRLFAWLAFSKRPLTLAEATCLVGLIIGENDSFSLDEEIEGKSGRILELGKDAVENDVGETDDEPNDDDDTPLAQANADEDGSAPLRFQERSLRNYFREMDVNQNGLRTAPPAAHLIILQMAASILDSSAGTSHTASLSSLQEYAANYWSDHFLELDPETTSQHDALTVLQSLAQILLGKDSVVKSMERVSPEGHGYFDCFWGEKTAQNHVIAAARKWIQKAGELDSRELSNEVTMLIAMKSEEEMVPLARAHTRSWWQGAEDSYDTVKSFEFVLSALLMTNLNPTFSADTLDSPSAADILLVADTFGDMEKDACARWTMGVTMRWYDHFEEAVVEFEKALQIATDDLNRFRTLSSLADVCRQQEKWEQSLDWATQALKCRPTEGDKFGLMIREVLNVRAASEIQLNRREQAIATIEESRQLVPGTVEMMSPTTLDSLTLVLAEDGRWEELMTRIESWTLWDRFSWLCWTWDGEARHERFQQAAKKTGRIAFLIQATEEIVRYLDTAYPRSAGIARKRLAEAYQFVIHDNVKAKKLYYEILDADACVDLLSGEESLYTLEATRFALAEIIYEEFRTSMDHATKAALLDELSKMPERKAGQLFDFFDSNTATILGNMYKKMGPIYKFQEVVDKTFKGCINGLEDSIGYNDSLSLRLLAKVLACVPGLERDAQIAYSAQFSWVDPEVSHLTYDTASSSYDSDADGSTPDEVDDAKNKSETGDRETEAVVEGGADAETEHEKEEKEKTEELDPMGSIYCNGDCASSAHSSWADGAIYICCICADCDLCEACYQKRQDLNHGAPSASWRAVCGKDHRYIKGPIQGWGGVKAGVMTIGEEKMPFKEWLADLKERKWKEAWERYWKNDEFGGSIL